jgi:hypothetical protein
MLAELRQAELVREQHGQSFQQANAQFRKVKLNSIHRFEVGTRGVV